VRRLPVDLKYGSMVGRLLEKVDRQQPPRQPGADYRDASHVSPYLSGIRSNQSCFSSAVLSIQQA
jgi:hypothetical protein